LIRVYRRPSSHWNQLFDDGNIVASVTNAARKNMGFHTVNGSIRLHCGA